MDTAKKIIIVYASAGYGHEKAARSIQEACESSGRVHSELFDTVRLAPGSFGEIYRQTYLLQIKYIPWLWGVFYYSFDLAWVYYGAMRFIRRLMNSMTTGRFEKILREKQPDVLVATHFLAVEVAGNMKRRKKLSSKIVAVVTDYMPHYVWMDDAVDRYVVAADFTKEALMQRGVPAEKISVFGIPIEKKFLEVKSRKEIAQRLGLREDVFTVLLTSGGAGIGALADVAKKILALEKPIQLLVVCGTNHHLFDALKPIADENRLLKVYQFVDNMDELMVASDIVVGKGGGLTVTESLAKKRPMILFGSVPGQEARNAVCLTLLGAAITARSLEEVLLGVARLSSHPEDLQRMKSKVDQISKPDAAVKICELVQEL